MSKPVTIEDIYELFRVSAEEFDRRLRESDRRAEVDKLERERHRAEIERILAESKAERERHRAEIERILAESKAESDRRAAESKAESDRRAAESKVESDRTIAELKQTAERTSRAVDSLTTRWEYFVEELVEPAMARLFQEKGIDIKEIYSRPWVKRQRIAMQIDILGVDDTALVVVECRSRLSQDDVDEFIEKLSRFKLAFTHYQNYQAYGAVAGIEINEGIDRYAYKKGLFVIKPSGNSVAIINDANFQPRTW